MTEQSPETECFLHLPQEFLVCTTVHKAKSLPVLNADTYVKVSLGKTTKLTKVFHNSENPYYNEYFVFEVPCTLAELLRLTVVYEVRRRTCCKTHATLGELLVDLHTVWNQPHRSFYRKWGRLLTSAGASPSTGHLQLDLAIVSPNQPAFPPPIPAADADDVESNLLQDLGMPPSNVRYRVSLYGGVFLKKADYMLQVTLAGMKAKTKACKATMNPEWSEQLQINWAYPSLSQTLVLQVMCRESVSWKCVADSEIYLDEVCFNATPSLGPTWMHFYDVHDYVGRVSVEISTEELSSTRDTIGRTISVGPRAGLAEGDWWTEEAFVLEFLAWQGDFVQANASNMKLLMSLAEHKSDSLECFLKSYASHKTTRKHFDQAPPFKAVHIRCFLPDNRLKYEADQFMLALVEQMRTEMENFKLLQLRCPQEESLHRKCLKAILLTILDRVQHPQCLRYNGFKRQSTWDDNRLAFLREFFERLASTLKELHDNLKASRQGEPPCRRVYQALQQLRGQIESIMQTRAQDEWPELQLHMSLGGGKASSKKFAICKLNARHFVFSQRSDCRGPWCGVPRNFVFKDTSCMHSCRNCGCLKGVVYGWLRVAAESEQTEFAYSADWEQKERFYYQPKGESSLVTCRVYVHQAKIQPGADSTGLCDAKLRLAFGGQMRETSTVSQSLAPVWNETLAFAGRRMPGPLRWYEDNPPLLAIELFDVDRLKVDDYMGCGLVELSFPAHGGASSATRHAKTRVALEKLREARNLSPPTLKWTPIAHMGASRVEILMSGELRQVDADEREAVLVAGIPREIQPSMGKYLLEVTFAGLRNCQKMASSSLGRYRIHVMMGELLLRSGVSGTRLKNSINFLENFASGVVSLPKQLQYWPPIIATQIDCRGRGREVTLAATLISDPSKYLRGEESHCESNETSVVQVSDEEESAPLLPARSIPKKSLFCRLKDRLRGLLPRRTGRTKPRPRPAVDESNYTWWTKFYNSLHLKEQSVESAPKHRLVIYDCELEKESAFGCLTDWAEPFPLIHGVKIKKNQPPKEEVFATLKMHLKLTPCSCNAALTPVPSRISSKIQSLSAMNEELKVLVRVYIVQGMNFRSHDAHSQSDSYVRLQLGSQVISDRANYVCNQSNPVYGKRFQLPATIPREHVLQISVYDRGGAADDLIGSTFIDLEDRVRSKHRATVGISDEFNRSGYNAWRDVVTPREILLDLCRKNNLGPPKFEAHSVEVDGVTFEEVESEGEDSREERLSLRVLKNWEALPSGGYRLVPEHVETRSLYRADRPGVEQGKLQLWIEIFDAVNVPPPMDITPTPPGMYELRVVVYNCADVPFQERNVFGTNMSDIYIKGWCEDNEASQRTDVHYRSLTGEGSFNWRMIFPLKYSPAEDMMVIRRKGGLFEVYETKQPPMVYLQIWEDDVLSADDFVGAMDLCLSHFPEPFPTRAACTERAIKKNRRRFVNLFQEKTARGWFPCRGPSEKDDFAVTGKLELGLEILPDRDAAAKPAGLGRNPPNALPPPDRPDTSFNPWSSPLKSIKHILVPAVMRCMRCMLLAVLVGVLLYVLCRDVLKEVLHKI